MISWKPLKISWPGKPKVKPLDNTHSFDYHIIGKSNEDVTTKNSPPRGFPSSPISRSFGEWEPLAQTWMDTQGRIASNKVGMRLPEIGEKNLSNSSWSECGKQLKTLAGAFSRPLGVVGTANKTPRRGADACMVLQHLAGYPGGNMAPENGTHTLCPLVAIMQKRG